MAAGKLVSLSFLAIGVILLIQVVLPLLSFEIWQIGQQISQNILISPRPNKQKILGVSVKNQNNFPAFVSDLTRETIPSYNEFNLTVSTIKIVDLPVVVDSNDLSKGLIHLPGSALPGEKGNVFISGHSALSPLFSFKKAPFANLTDVKKGDQLVVEAGGVKFTYKVVEIKVVDPSDVSVISPPDSLGRYISLMTCVPPGLNLKRLVVLGKMI